MKSLKVIFDTRHRGFTFDCVIFFVLADVIRELNNLDKMEVYIHIKGFRRKTEREFIYDDAEKLWRVHNIIAKVPLLLPSTNSIVIGDMLPQEWQVDVFPPGYHPEVPKEVATCVFQPKEFLAFKADNVEISRLRPLSHALEISKARVTHQKLVTISIRKSKFQEVRNSNLLAWKRLAGDLELMGYYPLFIPDFEDLEQCLEDPFLSHRILVDACSDLHLRMAYYAIAKHNFCVSNGTSALLYFSPYPFSLFGIVREGVNNCGADFLRHACGINIGEKYFWLRHQQHFVYTDDSYENLKHHLDYLILQGQLRLPNS